MASCLVVDASFTLRLILPGPMQASFHERVRQWRTDRIELCAPTLWLYETTSALCKVVRLGELTPAEGRQALALAQSLGVRLIPPDDALAHSAFEWTLRLNRTAAYDSFYLALTEALQCELWTADRRLRNAVDRGWLRWIESG
ncbi:MAG: type II toxin-antitoxin system VapC family toxin [Anaerolineae bacterium]|nr:type II toxin-antitoxin system VapC family toxin [Anaerolineae bacterium]